MGSRLEEHVYDTDTVAENGSVSYPQCRVCDRTNVVNQEQCGWTPLPNPLRPNTTNNDAPLSNLSVRGSNSDRVLYRWI